MLSIDKQIYRRFAVFFANSNIHQMIYADKFKMMSIVNNEISKYSKFDIAPIILQIIHSQQQEIQGVVHSNFAAKTLEKTRQLQKRHQIRLKIIQKKFEKYPRLQTSTYINPDVLRKLESSLPHISTILSICKINRIDAVNCVLYHILYVAKDIKDILFGLAEFNQQTFLLISQSQWKLQKIAIIQCRFLNCSIRSLQVLNLAEIRKLQLKCNSLRNGDIQALSKIKMPSLESLSLVFNNITHCGLKALQKTNYPNLKILNLSYNFIHHDGMKSLSGFTHCPTEQYNIHSRRNSSRQFWFYNHVAKLPASSSLLTLGCYWYIDALKIGNIQVPDQVIRVVKAKFGYFHQY